MQSRLVPENVLLVDFCQVYAPNIFDYDDHGIVLLKTSRMLDNNLFRKRTRECVKAYRKCPTRAIEISKNEC